MKGWLGCLFKFCSMSKANGSASLVFFHAFLMKVNFFLKFSYFSYLVSRKKEKREKEREKERERVMGKKSSIFFWRVFFSKYLYFLLLEGKSYCVKGYYYNCLCEKGITGRK